MNLKKTVIAAAAASLLGGASFVVASSFRNSNDDLFMANVEALTAGETSITVCLSLWGSCIMPDGTVTLGPAINVQHND